MNIWTAIGVVVAAVGAAVLLRMASDAILRLRNRWGLRKLRFCPKCGILVGDAATCLHCGADGLRPDAAGEGPSSPN